MAPSIPQPLKPLLDLGEKLGFKFQVDSESLSHALPCEVILRGADPSRSDDQRRPAQGQGENFMNSFSLIPDGALIPNRDANGSELAGEGGSVRIYDIAQQELGTNGDPFSVHVPVPGAQRGSG